LQTGNGQREPAVVIALGGSRYPYTGGADVDRADVRNRASASTGKRRAHLVAALGLGVPWRPRDHIADMLFCLID
jgi:hypothetical protein